jgi:surfactin synthase thioesterase subunit
MDALNSQWLPSGEPGDWGVRWQPRPAARLRLFCVPHAGGGAAAYRTWARALPPWIELVAIRLPGRETRFREPPFTRMDDLVAALAPALAPWLDRPYAWFGHSMGALIAYETARATRRLGLPEPLRLLVSGRAAPHLPPRDPPVHAASTADLVARLRFLGGTPVEVLDDAHMLKHVVPTLRADFAVVETYHWRPEPPLDCPLSVFGGTSDRHCMPGDLDGWSSHTSRDCAVRLFGGDHFFLHRPDRPLIPVIREHLQPARERSGLDLAVLPAPRAGEGPW